MAGGILGLIHLLLLIYAVVKTVESRATTGTKVLWIAVVLVFPVIGFLLWLFLGPARVGI
ncbi:MAG: PLDc N-terminal domain-containing protein [Idiomarina sp.]|nr:PLDc N-terminal domain-containing protein [Idiomarina sp.]